MFERTKSRHILSHVSLFTVLTMHCKGCVLCLSQVPSFFLYICTFPAFFRLSFLCIHVYFLTLSVFLPLTNSFRNPHLNASCCGFLQKLSMCLLSQSDPASGSYQHGMQIRTHTSHTQLHATPLKPCCSCQLPSNDVMLPVV